MKKMIALLLVAVMCISLVACGSEKKAFENSKAAYNNINIAYEITEQYGDDVYNAWRLAIYEQDKILEYGIEYLAKELSLSEDELIAGVGYLVEVLLPADWYGMTGDYDWLGGYEKCINKIAQDTDNVFELVRLNLYSFCVMLVQGSYVVNGKVAEAQSALDVAKEQMKELSEKYSDYEHYPNLKGYYVTTSSFFEFCQNLTGSFEENKDTFDKYKSEAHDYISNLDYFFE